MYLPVKWVFDSRRGENFPKLAFSRELVTLLDHPFSLSSVYPYIQPLLITE